MSKKKEIVLDVAGRDGRLPGNTSLAVLPKKSPGDMTEREFKKHLDVVSPVMPGKKEAKQLTKLYRDAQNGLRRVVALGLYCHQIKGALAHGDFKPWLEKHVPDLGYSSLNSYMALTENVLEASGLQISSVLYICHGGKSLLLPDKKVTSEAREVRDKIFSVIDGKSQRQLMLEFREAEEEEAPAKAKRKFHPPKPVSADEKISAKMRDALERMNLLIAQLQHYVEGDDNSILPDDYRRAGLDAGVEFTNHIRASFKRKKD